MWHTAELPTFAGWSSWSSLGKGGTHFSQNILAIYGPDWLYVFAVGEDSALWGMRQMDPPGKWTTWQKLGGSFTGSPLRAIVTRGTVYVFGEGFDTFGHPGGGIVYAVGVDDSWSFDTLPTFKPSGLSDVGRNTDNRLEVFSRNVDGNLWHIWEVSPGVWSNWNSFGIPIQNDNLRVASNSDGRLEVFAVDPHGRAGHLWQLPGGSWSPWADLSGVPAVVNLNLTSAVNKDGRLELFAQGFDGAVWHIWRQTGGGWNGQGA